MEEIKLKIECFANEVYSELGPGFSESVYHEAIKVILIENNIPFSSETVIPIHFHNRQIGFIRADLLIDEEYKYILELKAVSGVFKESEIDQLRNYLVRTNIPFGFLINFPQSNSKKSKDAINILTVTPDNYLEELPKEKKVLDLSFS